MSKDCSKEIFSAAKKFYNTQHWPIVESASAKYLKGQYPEAIEELKKLPDEKTLLSGLIEKCKGKPVYSNLRKILKNESILKADAEIAISSLVTRCLIEAKDNREYRSLLPDLIKKLQELTK